MNERPTFYPQQTPDRHTPDLTAGSSATYARSMPSNESVADEYARVKREGLYALPLNERVAASRKDRAGLTVVPDHDPAEQIPHTLDSFPTELAERRASREKENTTFNNIVAFALDFNRKVAKKPIAEWTREEMAEYYRELMRITPVGSRENQEAKAFATQLFDHIQHLYIDKLGENAYIKFQREQMDAHANHYMDPPDIEEYDGPDGFDLEGYFFAAKDRRVPEEQALRNMRVFLQGRYEDDEIDIPQAARRGASARPPSGGTAGSRTGSSSSSAGSSGSSGGGTPPPTGGPTGESDNSINGGGGDGGGTGSGGTNPPGNGGNNGTENLAEAYERAGERLNKIRNMNEFILNLEFAEHYMGILDPNTGAIYDIKDGSSPTGQGKNDRVTVIQMPDPQNHPEDWQDRSDPKKEHYIKFPILQIEEIAVKDADGKPVLKADGTPEKRKKLRLIEHNFVQYIRGEFNRFNGLNPTDPVEYLKTIGVRTRGQSHVELIRMLTYPDVYFIFQDDPDPTQVGSKMDYKGLSDQIFIEMVLSGWRNRGLDYRNIMGVASDVLKSIVGNAQNNPLTRNAWSKSYLEWFFGMSTNFKQGEGMYQKQDAKVGIAIAAMVRAYGSLANYDDLEKRLGRHAPLLSKKALEAEIIRQGKIKGKFTDKDEKDEAKRKAFFATIDDWNKMENLPDTGDLTRDQRITYANFINIYNVNNPNDIIADAVRQLMKRSVAEKYHLLYDDEHRDYNVNIDYAHTLAESFANFTGITAVNDVGGRGFDKWANVQNFKENANRPPGHRFGPPNPAVSLFPRLGSNMLDTISTEIPGENGIPKTIMKVIDEYLDKADKTAAEEDVLRTRLKGEGITDERVLDEKVWDALGKEGVANGYEDLKDVRSQLRFKVNTEREAAQNAFKNEFDLYEKLSTFKEINFGEFTTFDPVTQAAVMSEHKLAEVIEDNAKIFRNLYDTWKGEDLTEMQNIRMYAVKKIERRDMIGKKGQHYDVDRVPYYVSIPKAFARFGKEILDQPEFWKVTEVQDPTDPHKKIKKYELDPVTHQHIIDVDRVQKERMALVEYAFLGWLAAQVHKHVDRKSRDKRYDFRYYETIIDVLRQLPTDYLVSEHSFHENVAIGQAFEEHQIRWFRKKAGIGFWSNLMRDALRGPLRPGNIYKATKEGLKPVSQAVSRDYAKVA